MNSTPPNLPTAGEPLRVLFVAAEADPWVKVGGLGDFAGALPQALHSLPPEHAGGSRLDIRLVLPCHDVIRQVLHPKNPLVEFTILRGAVEVAGAAYLETSGEQQVLLIDGPPFQTGAPVYSSDSKQSAEQYTFFSLAALETTRRLGWKPHILHANDWHTAIAVYWLFLHRSRVPFFSKTRTVFSLHNLPYFGYNAEETLTSYGIPPAADPRLPTWARHLPLPLGLHAADKIVAVSPTYAREILTPAFGCGLQDYLKTRSNSISGILNGLDTDAWNPASDPALEAHFDAHDLTPRSINKEALQRELELSLLPDVPLLALISRLDPLKGVDLVIDGVRQMS
ncbi:MAG: glycogen/starch synthase, partial [Anaerolineaceae bacterium]|nr:glycogen/starch synthase [Anaerolineaceae bacterium]